MKIIKYMVFSYGLTVLSPVMALDMGSLKSIFSIRAGSKVEDQQDNKDLSKFKKKNFCKIHTPWAEPKIQDLEVANRVLNLCRTAFYVQYDPLIKMPLSVSEILTKENLTVEKRILTEDYALDPDLPNGMQPFIDDYSGSYDKTPLAVPGNMIIYQDPTSKKNIEQNKKAHLESYYFSNMVPMTKGLKKGLWADLDKTVKGWTVQTSDLYVITGPIFLNGQTKGFIGKGKVPVPTHFFKIIVDPRKYGSVAYVLPNQDIATSTNRPLDAKEAYYCNGRQCRLEDFVVSIRDLEKYTNLIFFPLLAKYYEVKIKHDITPMAQKSERKQAIEEK